MAQTITITIVINDEGSAKQWLEQVRGINEDYKRVMEEAAHALEATQDMMDGTLVDEIVKYGTDLLNAAQKTFEAMDAIADTVNKILDSVTNFVDSAVGGIGKLVSKVFN